MVLVYIQYSIPEQSNFQSVLITLNNVSKVVKGNVFKIHVKGADKEAVMSKHQRKTIKIRALKEMLKISERVFYEKNIHFGLRI